MNNNDANNKLDWMYKSANSLVNREEYLLGRSVDKTLEQLNAEEKEKKLGIVPPKNHVEHECIPPSIRDFNKIVQAEQVDISAKLQEDPLVAIKKREEEARRQFLQNPVQLKKLQEALQAQELRKKKAKHKKSKDDSDSEIDRKIVKKLKYLKGDPLGMAVSKKKKKKSKDEDALDTILMHKFNQLKDRLSQEDLNDILAGKVSDSDEEVEEHGKRQGKRKNSSDKETSDKQTKSKENERKGKNFNREKSLKKVSSGGRKNTSDISNSSDSSEDEMQYKKNSRREFSFRNKQNSTTKYKQSSSLDKNKHSYTSREDISEEDGDKTERRYRKSIVDKRKTEGERSLKSNLQNSNVNTETSRRKETSPDFDLESKILQKLRMLRDSSKSRRAESGSDSDSKDRSTYKKTKQPVTNNSSDSEQTSVQNYRNESDTDEKSSKPKSFGLVKADGTKIALNKKLYGEKKNDKPCKEITTTKSYRKNVKKLTEEEKEEMRREMMKNAESRDKERSENLKKYREEDKREEKSASHFDKDFMHKQLVRSTKEATVESRIKSNLNNIQRSSRHMDTNFSRR